MKIGFSLSSAASLAFSLISTTVHGQHAPEHRPGLVDRGQVGLQLGYLFGYDVDTVAGEVGFDGGLSYGLEGTIRVPSNTLLVLNYTWLPTELDLERAGGRTEDLGDLNLHFFQAGAQWEFLHGKVRPFAGLTLGTTLFSAERFDDEWKISTTLGGGVKYLPSSRFGVRGQVRLLNSFATTSSTIFCSFSGCDYGLTGGGILHAEFSAGAFWVF